jgi:hypothetical protein
LLALTVAHLMRREADRAGLHLSLRELFETLAGIGETVLLDHASGEARGVRFVDRNVLVDHLTGDPPNGASRAAAYLEADPELLLPDLVVAETVCVPESCYEAPREQIADSMRSLIAFASVVTIDPALRRALQV